MTVAEAGRKGREKVKEVYGTEFYSKIGEKDGSASHEAGGLQASDEQTQGIM